MGFGVLMDYHLIFMLVCFFLFFISVMFLWMVNTRQAVIVAIFFLSINQLFSILTMVGFYSIGVVGYDSASGSTIVVGYEGMVMFAWVFMCLLWLNGLMLFIAIFKYMRIVMHEQLGSEYGYQKGGPEDFYNT